MTQFSQSIYCILHRIGYHVPMCAGFCINILATTCKYYIRQGLLILLFSPLFSKNHYHHVEQMSLLVYDALTAALKVHDVAEKGGGFFF